jgi:CRISPR-associated protein Csm4
MEIEAWSIRGSGFHFGQHGLGQEETMVTLPSDSLFSALAARLARRDGSAAVDSWMAPFLGGSPPLVISSTFPLAGKVRFFPSLVRLDVEDAPGDQIKVLKKVRFVSESLFRALLDGKPLIELAPHAVVYQNGEVWVSQAETGQLPEELQPGGKLWQVEQRPRVTLGRGVQNSVIFFTGRVNYAAGCGLWFGIHWLKKDPAVAQQLEGLLADLADAGLGAERAVGFGACQIARDGRLSLPDASGGRWVNLSRYLPRPEETAALLYPGAAYSLRRVGGWLDSPVSNGQRRRPVTLLAEGAVLGPLPGGVLGRIAEVRPRYPTDLDPLKHPVYRCGLALAVGIK